MKKICTHSGCFHTDDALAVYFLLQLEEYANAEIVRSREEAIIDSCDVVVDVGGSYDHAKRRYDHHHASCVATFPGSSIPLAACGLIYFHFGKEVIKSVSKKLGLPQLDNEEDLEFVYNHLYFHFIQEIDATDSGVTQAPENYKANYYINSDIMHRISNLVPHWKSPNQDYDASFQEAVKLVGKEFEFFLSYDIKFSVDQFKITKDAYSTRFEFDASGKFMLLPYFFPVNEYLAPLEGDNRDTLFVIYQRSNGTWSIKGIQTGNQFELRKKLPFPGVSPQEMKEKTGIDGLVFAHKNPFLACFEKKEQVMQYAKLAAEYKKE